MIKKRLKRGFVVGMASIICLSCLLSVGVKAEVEEQSNKLIIDLVKLAPYAQWDNYYGKIKFGHYQTKVDCALYDYMTPVITFATESLDKTKTILMSPQWKQGYIRGKYHLYLPKAEKLVFETNFLSDKATSVGYFLEGERTKYVDLVRHGNSRRCDLSNLAGQKCKILLKTKGLSCGGTFMKWKGTRITAFYPEKGMPDLAVSPSDIEVVSQPDGNLAIKTIIQNIAKADSGKFVVKLYDGDSLLAQKESTSLKGRDSLALGWEGLKISDDAHELRVEIFSPGEENSRDNNKAVLIAQFPVYGTVIKNIEGSPYPWRIDEVKVNISKLWVNTANYRLKCTLFNFQDEYLETLEYDIPSDKDSISIKPFADKRTGWWKMKASILYKDKKIDSLSATFCKVPEPAVEPDRNAIFKINAGGSASRSQMTKDTGASYIRYCNWACYRANEPQKQDRKDKRASSDIDGMLKQGQIPHMYIHMGRPSPALDTIEKFGYKAASRYPYKKTGIWWALLGEQNNWIPPRDYAAIVKAFYKGAIKADPDVKICLMEMTWGGILDSGKQGTRYEWLAEVYPQAKGCFHAVGNNSYAHTPPEEAFHNYVVKPCIDIIEKNGDLGKIQMHTGEGALSATTGSLAACMVRMYLYQMGLREMGASLLNWFTIQDYWTPVSSGRNGLCKNSNHPKPTYQAYAVMTHNLTGAKFVEKKDVGENTYCYVFKKGKDIFACLWKDKGKGEILVLPVKRKLTITNLMGEAMAVKVQKNSVKIPISFEPVYVRGLDLKKFKVIDRYEHISKVSFDDRYPAGIKLLDKKTMQARVYYNMAKKKWLNGELGIDAVIGQGLESFSPKPFPAKDTVVAKLFNKPIVLDGVLSEWQGVPSYNVSGPEHWQGRGTGSGCIQYSGDDNLSYTFQLGWDKDNLYLAFRVKDEKVISKYKSRGVGGYGGDCIETYIDVLNKRDAVPGIEFSQHFFGLNNEVGRIGGSGEILARMAWKKTDKGYNAEIAFPLKEIFLDDLKQGYRIAFNVQMDDGDKLGNLEGWSLWRRLEGQHNARNATDLIFSGESP